MALLWSNPGAAQELPRSGFLGLALAPAGDSGVVVRTVLPGGSAEGSGIHPGDLIVRMNEQKASDPAQVITLARKLRPGDVASLDYRRGEQSLNLKFVIRPRPQESAPDVETRYQSVRAGDSLRRTILTLPRAPGRHPAVLYLTGIGCYSQEDVSFAGTETKLLYGLTRAGFVTMRVEKTGVGDSQGPPCTSPSSAMQQEVAGYLAGLTQLKRLADVDTSHVFLMGLSIGGVEAPLVARGQELQESL
jgi:hypothetical protein